MSISLTPTQFWLQYGYKPFEFVDGQVIRRPKLRMVESIVLLRVTALIEQHVAENELGEVVSGIGFRLTSTSIRAPHTAFIAKALWDTVRHPYSPFGFAPTLVIDLSPDDRADVTMPTPYLAAGTAQVWAVQIASQQIIVHSAHSVPQVYNLGDTLNGEPVLPGLRLPIASLFPKSRHL